MLRLWSKIEWQSGNNDLPQLVLFIMFQITLVVHNQTGENIAAEITNNDTAQQYTHADTLKFDLFVLYICTSNMLTIATILWHKI